MNQAVSTKDPVAVAGEVQAAYLAMFPKGNRQFVPGAFDSAAKCFTGQYADYQAVDTDYHDFEHTLQGALCMVQILHGRQMAGENPPLTQIFFELGLLAILLHDTGYLKKRDDIEGTGAKYTATHVNRSTEFAAKLLAEKGHHLADILSVQNMIRCTGVDATLSNIPFHDELEKIVGYALGTADLLGQMAAVDYVEKLPILYAEFHEAGHSKAGKSNFTSMFSSARDLLRKTPDFWEKYVKLKLTRDFGGVFKFLNDPYPGGTNFYMDRIEANVKRLRALIADEESTTTFLKKSRVVARQ